MNKKTVPVSVVVPCFRCALTIDRAIESILQQTVLPQEIILVDDASKDATAAALINIQKRVGDLVIIISKDINGGAATARNSGWDWATQPYVAFLDSDDAWHPCKLQRQYSFMEANKDVVLSGHSHRILSPNAPLPSWEVAPQQAIHIGKLSMLLTNKFVTPSTMIKSEINFRFVTDQRHMEDHMLWLHIAMSGQKIVKLDEELAAIYKPSFGASGLSSDLWLMERADLRNYHRLYAENHLNRIQLYVLLSYSIAKFMRRLLIITSRKLFRV